MEIISIITILRGILGLVSLIFISFLISNNRKNIQWKTVFISILIQFLVAISILKISLIQSIFKVISKFFVRVINYTTSGSTFLFSSLVDQEKIILHICISSFTYNNLFLCINLNALSFGNHSKDSFIFGLVIK